MCASILFSIGFCLSHCGSIWERSPELGCGGGVRFVVSVVDFASLLAAVVVMLATDELYSALWN